jgi:hypothetical protein
MIFAHLRLRRRVALLASGVLEGRERDETRAHVDACDHCRREYEELRTLVGTMEADPVRSAEPEVPVSILLDRVERELDRAPASPPSPALGWRLALPAAAAAVLALVLLEPEVGTRLAPPPPSPAATAETSEAVPPEILDRLERNLTRQHAAHYLSEAQDVLLAVAATEADCDRTDGGIDVGEAPDRSRDLLARRTLLVEGQPEAVASARAVLDDVELALREVADLPSCVRRRDVQRLRQEIDRRQLHMRIRLMTRELEG